VGMWHAGNQLWVANSRGCMEALDMRAQRMGGALAGASGSVRSLAAHSQQPLLASGGLDRCLRVHSTATRKLVGKCYLKQQLASVCFLPVAPQQALHGVPPCTCGAMRCTGNGPVACAGGMRQIHVAALQSGARGRVSFACHNTGNARLDQLHALGSIKPTDTTAPPASLPASMPTASCVWVVQRLDAALLTCINMLTWAACRSPHRSCHCRALLTTNSSMLRCATLGSLAACCHDVWRPALPCTGCSP
jgi:hypothetical protein